MAEEQLVQYIAENLVNSPDEVRVTTKESGRSIVLELSVAPGRYGAHHRTQRTGGEFHPRAPACRVLKRRSGRDRRRRVILEIE